LLVINTGGELGRFIIGGFPYYKIENKPTLIEEPVMLTAAPVEPEAGSPVGLIIGIIVGLLIIVALILLFLYLRKKKNPTNKQIANGEVERDELDKVLP